MASTTNLRGTKLAVGQDSKEETINELFDIQDAAIAGKLDVTITTANVTLTGTPDAPQAQNKFFNLSGTLTGNRDLIFPVNDDDPATGNPRLIVVKNGTSGAFTVTVKVSGQTGVTVTQGTTAILLHNGTDFAKLFEVNHTTGILSTSSLGAAWSSWVPSWTNVTVGNGTVVAKYAQIGKTVICRLHFTLGSTSAVSGDIIFTLPVTAATHAGTVTLTPWGTCRAYDQSGGTIDEGTVSNFSTTQAAARFMNTSGASARQLVGSATVPFTWGTSDELGCTFTYEAA